MIKGALIIDFNEPAAVLEITAIAVLGGVANPQSWEGEAVGGWGWYRSKERL